MQSKSLYDDTRLHNDVNELTKREETTITLSYDDNGNLTATPRA